MTGHRQGASGNRRRTAEHGVSRRQARGSRGRQGKWGIPIAFASRGIKDQVLRDFTGSNRRPEWNHGNNGGPWPLVSSQVNCGDLVIVSQTVDQPGLQRGQGIGLGRDEQIRRGATRSPIHLVTGNITFRICIPIQNHRLIAS